MISWINHEYLEEEIHDWVAEKLGVKVHPAAVRHLKSTIDDKSIAFPRLEKHDGYLFGIVYLPSNVTNPAADFDVIVFVATHDQVVASIIKHGTSQVNWEEVQATLGDYDRNDDTPDGGQFILNLFRETVEKNRKDAENIRDDIEKVISEETPSDDVRSLEELGRMPIAEQLSTNPADLSKERRKGMLKRFNKLAAPLAQITADMPEMMRVAVETERILFKLSTDDEAVDLKKDQDGKDRELFSKDLEIYMADAWEQCRIVVATLEEIKSLIEAFDNLTIHLSDEENVAAGRFTGAIASIMLLPTFIVGLYGQNFASMPETDWQHGYLFSWGAIIFLTLAQIIFFKVKKWI